MSATDEVERLTAQLANIKMLVREVYEANTAAGVTRMLTMRQECAWMRLMSVAEHESMAQDTETVSAAAAADIKHSSDLQRLALRAIAAWDDSVLPKSNDGMMQERMEDLRAVALLRA